MNSKNLNLNDIFQSMPEENESNLGVFIGKRNFEEIELNRVNFLDINMVEDVGGKANEKQ